MKTTHVIYLNICLSVFIIALSFFIGFYFYPNASHHFTSGFQFTFNLFFVFSLVHVVLRMRYNTKELTLLALAYLVLGIMLSFVSFIPPGYNFDKQQKRREEILKKMELSDGVYEVSSAPKPQVSDAISGENSEVEQTDTEKSIDNLDEK